MQEENRKQSYGGKSNTSDKTTEKKLSLWDKMWEEYVESVSARRQKRKRKKEQRMAKQQEKFRKLSQKGTSFAKIFVNIFFPVLFFTVMLCVVGTMIAYQNIRRAVEEEFGGVFDGIQAELFEDYERLYDSENPASYDEDWIIDAKWRMLMQTPVYTDSFTAVLYDTSNMSKVFDSSEMFEIGVALDENGEKKENYASGQEPFQEVMEEYARLESTYPQSSFSLELEDCYVKGKKFLPGKVSIVDENGKKFIPGKGLALNRDGEENVVSFDLTPENTEGYTHIYNDNNRIYGPVWTGNTSMYTYNRWLERLQADGESWNDFMEYDGGSVHLKDGTDECLMLFTKFSSSMFFTKSSSEDEGVPDLLLVSFWSYNILEMYGRRAFGIYIGIFLLSVVLSLILAYRSYFRYQAQNQMNQYRRDMTNAMAHDLKSPLMVISGYAENLRDNVHMEKKDYYAEAILENVQYMNEIIHNILHLTQIEGGAGKLKRAEVNMQRLTEEQLHKYEGCIEDKGLEISVDLKDMGCLQADEKLMTQVVDNLLSNAVKYTREQGQIFVKAAADYYEVRNSLEEPLGIDVTELWKPFVKGDNSRGNQQGSGIGLTIVKNIVEQHGFKLELLEEEGMFVARLHF